jgi:uncharacterized spore protein YtfJ
MAVQQVIAQARDAITVQRVFGEPFDGVTFVPVAKVQGGAGGGDGEAPQGQGKGSGSGLGINARPIGAFMIRGQEVTFPPAVDVNRLILGGQIVVIVALLTVRAILKARSTRS